MSSPVTQLVAIGAQDVHLTGQPEISFYRSAYKRHSNFSMGTVKQVIRGIPQPKGMSSVNITRNGDLLSYMYIVAHDGAGKAVYVNDWTTLIESVELLVGGQVIDKQDSVFCEAIAIDTMAVNYSKNYNAALHGGLSNDSYFYPLRFFCCENWQSVLPLVCLAYHDVEIRINWNAPGSYKYDLVGNFISLGKDELDYFTDKESHDILITQVQKSVPSNEKTQELNFNHPVKFIASSNVGVYDVNTLASVDTRIRVEANGTEIMEEKMAIPHYTAVPSYYHTDFSTGNNDNLFIIPFCLSTNKLQPSGTLNFSRLDSFRIHCSAPITKPVYAVNYNILKVKNGMGGLMYAN